jgi:hypothetical protein
MSFEENEPGEPRHWGTTVAIMASVRAIHHLF